MSHPFTKTAAYYDALHERKDYAGEAQRLVSFVGTNPDGHEITLLDVACGTGLHLEHLPTHFDVEGLDISPQQLDIARMRLPDVSFHLGDMTDFDLGKQYDVVTCLFSSIAYVKTLDRLKQAVRSMAAHLKSRGTLVVEPFLTPENWHPNTVHGRYVDEPDLKIARVYTSLINGKVAVFDMHYLIGTPDRTEHHVERHEMGLFEAAEMNSAMEEAGLTVTYDAEGLNGRGLYIGRKNG